MKIVLTGGGSGGHITPILAVAHELKRIQPNCQITYIGQADEALLDIVRQHPAIDAIETVSAGKLRRYSGEGLRQLLDVRTQALNIRDVFRTLRGTFQSYRLLTRIRPAVVFTRGGFVSVPVATAARLRRIPYITHDSDSVLSLANKLIAKGAALHAVTMPPEEYPYPSDKTIQTGVPVGYEFKKVTPKDMEQYRHELQLDEYSPVILITGGGNGARALNIAVIQNIRYVLSTYPNAVLLHFAGRALVAETNDAYDGLELGGARDRVKVFGFVPDFYRYSGAADVIVARGGATNIAEFAVQHKPCIIVPSKQLPWNVHNSHMLASRGAAVELTEDQAEQPERLGRTIAELIDNSEQRSIYGEKLAAYGNPTAAEDIAAEIVRIGAR